MSGHGKVTMEEGENMPIKKVNHIAIAVKDIDKGISFYRDILRLPYYGTQIVEAAGCKAARRCARRSQTAARAPTSLLG